MAFNPFHTFQKNRRFWMATILMVCMVSFVFCTGFKGDMGERLMAMLKSKGPPVAKIGGYNISREDLYDLKNQRNLANDIMVRCADIAFRKLSKLWFEEQRKQAASEPTQARQAALFQLSRMRMSIAARKNQARYFDSGTKFDDLLEFKLWLVQADRMGIQIDDSHIDYLFHAEFFSDPRKSDSLLTEQEIIGAQYEAGRNYRVTNNATVRKAIADEFRVRIAQYAVLGFQLWPWMDPSRKEGYTPKYITPDIPDEIRAPLTPAQLWDDYKKNRAEFDVTLIPIPVDLFVKQIEAPNDIQKRDFFNDHKNKVFDPASPDWGLEITQQIKVEYVMADPTSPAYLNRAKAKNQVEAMTPLAWNPMQSPLVTAARYLAVAQAEKQSLQRQYDVISHSQYLTAPNRAQDIVTPLVAWTARRHPEAAAVLIANGLVASTDGFGPLAGYLAWGATKNADEIEAGVCAEVKRRAPIFASLFAASTSNHPLEMLAPIASLYADASPPMLPVEVVQTELREMLARRKAEEWARDSMRIVRKELEDANGDSAKFKRVLKKYVPELNLTYAPPPDDRERYYDRFSIVKAKEFEPLKESFDKYVDLINFFEGRDTTPEKLLKPSDYYKIYFDSSEHFAATSLFKAMPWPPEVTPNSIRTWKDPDPRMFNHANLNLNHEMLMDFRNFMQQHDPNRQAPSYDHLFKNAEKPILFWRTAYIDPQRPGDYDKINKDLRKANDNLAKIEEELKQVGKDAVKKNDLQKKRGELKQGVDDLKEIQDRITQGWKFERAHTTVALPKALAVAKTLIKKSNDPDELKVQAQALKQEPILLNGVSKLQVDRLGNAMEYFPYALPKDKIIYPRDDMAPQLVSLYDLARPIDIKYADLDKINKELYDLVKDEKRPQGKFVQIFTNKPHSVFYVAVVTSLPKADRFLFSLSVMAALPAHVQAQFRNRDLFVPRAQQQEGKQEREAIVRDLQRMLDFTIEDSEARKNFDEKGGD